MALAALPEVKTETRTPAHTLNDAPVVAIKHRPNKDLPVRGWPAPCSRSPQPGRLRNHVGVAVAPRDRFETDPLCSLFVRHFMGDISVHLLRGRLAAGADCAGTPLPGARRPRGRGELFEVPRRGPGTVARQVPDLPQAHRRPHRAEGRCTSDGDGRLQRVPRGASRPTPIFASSTHGTSTTRPKPASRSRTSTRGSRPTARPATRNASSSTPGRPAVRATRTSTRARSAPTARNATRRRWYSKTRARIFNHTRAAFQLTGAHQRVACEKCHTAGVFRGLRFDTCSSCHKAPHRNELGPSCTSCHTTRRLGDAHDRARERPASPSPAPISTCRARSATPQA